MRRSLTIAAALLLAGCGSAGKLEPGTGQELPVKPYGATVTPTASELLTPTNQARPERSDELLKKSETRRGDDFTLPPPN